MPRKKKIVVEGYDKNIGKYFEEISRYSSLSKDEELSLWRKYKYDNDLEARNKLISSNLKFVASIAKSYQGRGLSYADLIAEGNMGLIKAMNKYDAERGFKAMSYSVWWIRQSILEALQKRNLIEDDELPQEYEPQPSDDAIYYAQDISPYIDEIVAEEDKTMKRKEEVSTVNFLMNNLSERERKVVSSYYGLTNQRPMTLDEIGENMGLTKERVRQINEKALKKLRATALAKSITSDIYR